MATSAVRRVGTQRRSGLPWQRRLQIRLILTDAVLVGVALLIAVLARFGDSPSERVAGFAALSYTQTAFVLGLAWMVCLAGFGTYSMNVVAVGSDEYRHIARATLFLFGTVAITATLLRLHLARGFLAIAFPLGVVLLVLGRLIHRRLLVAERLRGQFLEQALVVGSPAEVRYVTESIRRTPLAGYQVVAVATGRSAGAFELSDGDELPETGDLNKVASSATAMGATTVIVAGQGSTSPTFMRELGWELEERDCHLVLASRLTDIAGPRIHWRPIEGLPLISVEMPRYSGVKYLFKRAFDLVLAFLMTLVLSPVMLVAAVMIRLEDRGPVLYRQRRVGVNGEAFTMHKFRSMVVDADRQDILEQGHDGNSTLFKLRDDPRVTRVGAVIRRYSIDELPQLFDVLRGQMSLVGPRPPLPSEVATYAEHVRRRLYVKPGITGPWQIGGRSNLTWEESVRKDLYYVENWSMTGDLLILIKTVRAVLTKDGAY